MSVLVRRDARARRTRTCVQVAAAMVALGLLLAGCTGGSEGNPNGSANGEGTTPAPSQTDIVKDASGPPKMGGTLRVALEAETDGWDPSKNRWAPSAYIVASAIYDPLVMVDDNFQPKPYLAESFSHNEDFTVWTMKLRTGIVYSDGAPLTAEWVNEWLQTLRASTLTSPALTMVESSTVIDPLTISVTMKAPWSAYPYQLTTQGGYIPSPNTVKPSDPAQLPSGTGPFHMTRWERDKQLVVEKNPDYWRKGMPYLDGIQFRPIADSNSRISALMANDTDLFMASLADPVAQLTASAEAGDIQVVHSQGDQDANFVMFNVSQPPFDDVRVRQALAYAIDRPLLREISNTPPSQGADSLYTKDSRWYLDMGAFYPYDLAKAKSLIADYAKDKGPLSFTFTTTTDPEVLKSTTAIMQMWQAAGADVKSESLEQTTFVQNVVTGKYQTAIFRLFGNSDPDSNYVWWIGANAVTPVFTLNAARNQDAQIDKALDAARETLDPSTRKAQYDIVQRRFRELVPYIWLSHVTWTMAARNNVRNIQHLELPDGSKSIGLVNGVFPVGGIWLDG